MNSLEKNNERNVSMPSKLKNEIYKKLYRLPKSPSLTSSPKASFVLVNHSHIFPRSFNIYVNLSNLHIT